MNLLELIKAAASRDAVSVINLGYQSITVIPILLRAVLRVEQEGCRFRATPGYSDAPTCRATYPTNEAPWCSACTCAAALEIVDVK